MRLFLFFQRALAAAATCFVRARVYRSRSDVSFFYINCDANWPICLHKKKTFFKKKQHMSGDNRCMQRVLTGGALGGAVGGAVGACYGTYEAFAYKV